MLVNRMQSSMFSGTSSNRCFMMTPEKVTITLGNDTIKTRFASGRIFIEFCKRKFKNRTRNEVFQHNTR